MASFLEETIQSVLSQDYAPIEYIIMDGGSTDATLEILERYQGRLEYVSGPDEGAAQAIARGFARGRGSILAWLSADDTYAPHAVSTAVRALAAEPDAAAVYGEAQWMDAEGRPVSRYPTGPFDPETLQFRCFLCQPACFFRREAYAEAGGLDTKLRCAYDYELWMRMAKKGRFAAIPQVLASSRMHASNKTLGQRRTVLHECMGTVRRHYGYVPVSWMVEYARYLLGDTGFTATKPTWMNYLLSLPLGIRGNPGQRARFFGEWLGRIHRHLFPRRG
jgi:glycosyltransferase involved in cell wall biosynthesis